MEHNEKLKNLLIAARNARETSDDETAMKHYAEVSALDPNNWEALFYLMVLKTNVIKYGEISNAAIGVTNCLPKVFQLINTTIQDEQEKKAAVQNVQKQCINTAAWLIKASGNYYNALTKNDPTFSAFGAAMKMDQKRHARYDSANRAVNIGNIVGLCGNLIESTFGLEDAFYQNLAVACWKEVMNVHFGHIQTYKVAVYKEEYVQDVAAKIKRFDTAYETPTIKATEKRNYTIAGILLAAGVFVATLLWYLWVFN